MKTSRKILSVILIIFTVFAFFGTAAHAEDEEITLNEIYKDHKSYTMVASRKGYFKYAPENSIKAIKAAENAGADIIEIDVRTTADGVLILMEDETVERTCYGYGENTVVSEMTYNEIKDLKLLEGQGGHGATKTQETVPTLEEVFRQRFITYTSDSSPGTKQRSLLMIDASWELRDAICNLAAENNILGDIIFYIDDAKPDEIAAWKASLPAEPMVMTYFKGNVIFAATACIRKASEAADGIHLATKNHYGVIFGETVQNTAYESGIRTMAAPCIPELCGTKMQDTQVWWDKLVSQGFNIILTDNVNELRDYVDSSHSKALELDWANNAFVCNWELPDFSSDKFFDYKLAYTNATEKVDNLLSRDMSRSYSDIVTAVYELKKAYDDINNNYDELADGTAGKTVNPVTIFLAAAAIAVVTVAEIYVYKKKKR